MTKDIIQAQAESIVRSSKAYNKPVTYSEALETLAQLYQFNDYNTFSAWLKATPEFAEKLTTEINKRKVSLFTTEKVEKPTKHLSKPISKKAIKAKIANEDWIINETIKVGFYDIMGMDIDTFNDYAEETILGNNAHGLKIEGEDVSVVLTDISYKVVGHVPGFDYDAGEVLVEVNAVLDIM